MRGKDEMTRIEAFGSPRNAECRDAPSQKSWHATARDVRYRCAAAQLYSTALEAAAMLQQQDLRGGQPRACAKPTPC